MIFFSHSSRIRILQLTFALVCSCLEGLLTTEKHHLVPFSLLIFCILLFKYSNKVLLFSWYAGNRVKKCISSSKSFLQIGQILSSGFLWGLIYREAPPWGPTPYPAMKYHSDRKGTQLFHIPSFDKIWYCPFHIPSLELCIPF